MLFNLHMVSGMGSYFSLAQWQELELQALIFRHMAAGAAVPPELLHLVKKSLIATPSQYYICNPLHQYYPHYQPARKLYPSQISVEVNKLDFFFTRCVEGFIRYQIFLIYICDLN